MKESRTARETYVDRMSELRQILFQEVGDAYQTIGGPGQKEELDAIMGALIDAPPRGPELLAAVAPLVDFLRKRGALR